MPYDKALLLRISGYISVTYNKLWILHVNYRPQPGKTTSFVKLSDTTILAKVYSLTNSLDTSHDATTYVDVLDIIDQAIINDFVTDVSFLIHDITSDCQVDDACEPSTYLTIVLADSIWLQHLTATIMSPPEALSSISIYDLDQTAIIIVQLHDEVYIDDTISYDTSTTLASDLALGIDIVTYASTSLYGDLSLATDIFSNISTTQLLVDTLNLEYLLYSVRYVEGGINGVIINLSTGTFSFIKELPFIPSYSFRIMSDGLYVDTNTNQYEATIGVNISSLSLANKKRLEKIKTNATPTTLSIITEGAVVSLTPNSHVTQIPRGLRFSKGLILLNTKNDVEFIDLRVVTEQRNK